MSVKLGAPSQLNDDYSDEWYTPAKYVEPARLTMGGIDLDPASNPIANKIVKAEKYYTKEDNSLTKPWWGRVWLNPPYSNTSAWTRKIERSYVHGEVTEAVILINGWTEGGWFQPLYDYPICFVKGRIKFYRPKLSSGTSPSNSAIVYFGPNSDKFARAYERFGVTVIKHPVLRGGPRAILPRL